MEDVLGDHRFLAARARRLIERGAVPTEDGWGGWIGRYQAGVRKYALELAQQVQRLEETAPVGGHEKGIDHMADEEAVSDDPTAARIDRAETVTQSLGARRTEPELEGYPWHTT